MPFLAAFLHSEVQGRRMGPEFGAGNRRGRKRGSAFGRDLGGVWGREVTSGAGGEL